MFMIFYKHIKEVKSTLLLCYSTEKYRVMSYSSSLFELLIQIENILFQNAINILMEYRYNSYTIYQELL